MQKMLSYVRRAVDQYHMIEEGDVIAVGVSGGKDSLALLSALAGLRRFYPKKFEVKAITLEMGYDEMDFTPVAALCQKLGVEFITEQTDIKTVVFDIRKEENPCSLCANMRRGALNSTAKAHGCNKVALRPSFDDVVETVLMSLLYEGRFSCFLPVTYLDRAGVTVIRPMVYTPESYIRSLAKRLELPIVHNPCPVDGSTKREEIKQLLRSLEHTNPGVRQRIFGAIQRYPLRAGRRTKPSDEKKANNKTRLPVRQPDRKPLLCVYFAERLYTRERLTCLPVSFSALMLLRAVRFRRAGRFIRRLPS